MADYERGEHLGAGVIGGVTFDLFDVCMVDLNNAWACGFRDTFPIIVSKDGGQTWTSQRTPNTFTAMLTGISFSDTLHGITVGYGQDIYRTDNGGNQWIDIIPPVAKSKTKAILVDSIWGWMVGTLWQDSTALIEHTTDGGRTWTVQNPGTNRCLYSVSFTDRRNGWAVGNGGTIVHTTDGGVGVEEKAEGSKQMSEGRITARPNPFVSFATMPGHEAERFALYDISGREVGVFRGDRIGCGLTPGVYFLRPENGSAKPLRIVKIR